ncbi:hypothetical protein RB598_009615 [Gaeumannomyces tritici]
MAAVQDLTRGPALLGVSITTALIALSSTALRFVARATPSEDMGSDDYVVGVASIIAFIGTVLSILEGTSMTESVLALEYDVLGQPWFFLGATLAKVSICLFFIRITGGVKLWRVLLMTLVVMLVVFNFAFALTSNLQCRPLEKLWNMNANGECWDPSVQLGLDYFRGAFSVFSWLFMSLFPVLLIRDLESDQAMRLLFYILSGLSLVAGAFATSQTYEYSQVPRQSGVFTYAHFVSTLLAIMEQNIAIVAANVLPLGPLLSRLCPAGRGRGPSSLFSKRSNSGSTSAGSSRSYWPRKRSGTGTTNASGRPGPAGRFAQLKDSPSTVTLLIEGPQRESYELSSSPARPAAAATASKSLGGLLTRSDSRQSSRSARSAAAAAAAADAWPKGIIKTVEVQVVEEDIADIERADQAISAAASASSEPEENEWDRAMRNNPSRLGNR